MLLQRNSEKLILVETLDNKLVLNLHLQPKIQVSIQLNQTWDLTMNLQVRIFQDKMHVF